jgi:hypothetical protein
MAAEKTTGLAPKVAGGLAEGAKGLATMAGKRLLSSATDRIGETTQRLTDYTDNGGGPGLMSAITGRGGQSGNGGKGKSLKVTNIVEWIDVGVPVRLAYDQWTRFTDFPTFMKKVESVEQEEETKLRWKAQVLWSHRTWESTIIEQVPDRRIVWESEGEKGTVNGAVTFHELGPELTRICLILQYYPQGFFERTGNIWRAQGRRARLELKHFARHVMTDAVLHPDEVRGWRGEIHDGEVTKDDEKARAEQERPQEQGAQEEGGAQPSRLDERRSRRDEQRQTRRADDARSSDRPKAAPRRRPADDEDRSARGPGRGRDESRRVAGRGR